MLKGDKGRPFSSKQRTEGATEMQIFTRSLERRIRQPKCPFKAKEGMENVCMFTRKVRIARQLQTVDTSTL